MSKLEMTISRALRSLITTSARSVKVNGVERASFEQFINEGQSILTQVEPEYPHEPGVRLFYLLNVNSNTNVDWSITDVVKVNESFLNKFQSLAISAAGNWYSVPDNQLRYDLTNLNSTLVMFMVGAALSLLPWKDDNTFQLTMHGKQLDPGCYWFKIVDMFIFNRSLQSKQGTFRMLSEEIDYALEITEGYVRGVRKRNGRKAINMKQDKSVVIERVKMPDRGRGMSSI